MMTMGTWMTRIRDARPLRDALGVILLAVTAILYTAEHQRARAMEGGEGSQPAVVVEPSEAPDRPAKAVTREGSPPGVVLATDRRC